MKKITFISFALLLTSLSAFAQTPTAIISGGGSVCDPTTDNYDVVITVTGSTPSYTVVYSIDGIDQPAVTGVSPYTITTPTEGTYRLTSVTEVGGNGFSANPADLAGNVEVKITPSATVTITGDATAICEGDKITFTAAVTNTTPTTYKWIVGGVGEVAQTSTPTISTLNLTSSSSVSVKVANNVACGGADVESKPTHVTVKELLQPLLDPIDVTVCSSDLPLTLTTIEVNNNSTNTIVWIKDGSTLSETSAQLAVTETGTYEVTFISGANCQSKSIPGRTISTIKVQDCSTTATNPIAVNNTTIIYPTLISESFQTSLTGSYQVFIYTQEGKLVKQKTIESQQKIEVNDLKNGTYIVKLVQGDFLMTEKIIINK